MLVNTSVEKVALCGAKWSKSKVEIYTSFPTQKLLSDNTFAGRIDPENILADTLQTNTLQDFVKKNNYVSIKSLGSENANFNFCSVIN